MVSSWRAQARTGISSIRPVAAPGPDQGVGQGLFEDAPVAVVGGAAEDKAMVISLGFERRRGALAGHHPVMMRLLRVLGANIILGHMGKDPQRLLLAGFDQLHARVVLPRPQRIAGFLRGIVIL